MKIANLKAKINKEIKNPRRQCDNKMHKLKNLIIIRLCATICRCENLVEIEDFGRKRKEWRREFPELLNGIPDSDIFRRLFVKNKSVGTFKLSMELA